MIPLSQLLTRFKSLTNTEKVKKQVVSEIVSSILNFNISLESVSFSKNTVYIKVSPIIKTEIILKKQEILIKIKLIPGFEYIQDLQ